MTTHTSPLLLKAPFLLLVIALLNGCAGEEFGDLKEWMRSETQNMRGKVDPLPEVKPYEPFVYNAFDMVDPFNASKMVVSKKGGGALAPNQDRPKETLEAYDLEKLHMVGTLQQGKDVHALIKAPDGNLYRIKVGAYLGQNFGMVTSISESEVTLKEIVEDSAGDWVERVSTLNLEETEQAR